MVQPPTSAREITLEAIRAVLEFSPIPTFLLHWEKIVYINPAAAALLGEEDAEETIYRFILQFIPEECEETRRKRLEHLRRAGDRITLDRKKWMRRQGKWTRQNGGPIVLDVRAWTLPFADGNATQVSLTDVTLADRERQGQEQREQHLRLAVDSAEIGVWDYDPTTGKIRWSRQCRTIFSMPRNTPVDYSAFLKLLHPEDRARTDRAVEESLNPEGTGEYGNDYRVLCPDGTVRWIAVKGHAFFSNRGGKRKATRLIGTALDITGLRQSDASLRENEKLAVTGRLAASIAHEINNPLEAITNLLYLLDDSSLEAEQRKYIRLAQQELARVVDISIQALRFYRDPSAPAPCNVGEIIDSALTLFNGRISAFQIQIEREDCKRAVVLGAREELRQVVVNMIHNAMDAMPHGGRLLLRTECATNWRSGRSGVRIAIADTGHGMNQGTMKRIFEPFFTTRVDVGTGLGLWLCAGIVQKHGGSIQVKSSQRPGRSGTVFSIFLPFDRRR